MGMDGKNKKRDTNFSIFQFFIKNEIINYKTNYLKIENAFQFISTNFQFSNFI